MSSSQLKREKKLVRSRIRALRDALEPRDRERASSAIAGRVLALPELAAAGTAMVFASFGSEVDTAPIVEAMLERDIRVALPRVERSDLSPISYRIGDPLTAAAFGMPEPSGNDLVPLADIDVVVTPGLAFDRAGHRVGYGGGFYDRFFAAARPDVAKLAVCFHVQLVDEVPHGAFDVPVDVIVTEREVIRPRR